MFKEMIDNELITFGALARLTVMNYGASQFNDRSLNFDTHEEQRANLADALNEHAEYVDALAEAHERDDETGGAVRAFVDEFGVDVSDGDEVRTMLMAFEDSWVQDVSTLEEMVEQELEGRDDIPEDLRTHIDVDSIVNDYEQGGVYSVNDGFVFRCDW